MYYYLLLFLIIYYQLKLSLYRFLLFFLNGLGNIPQISKYKIFRCDSSKQIRGNGSDPYSHSASSRCTGNKRSLPFCNYTLVTVFRVHVQSKCDKLGSIFMFPGRFLYTRIQQWSETFLCKFFGRFLVHNFHLLENLSVKGSTNLISKHLVLQ